MLKASGRTPAQELARRAKFQLKRFDIEAMSIDKVILMVGQRNSGKTSMEMHFLYHKRTQFDNAYAFIGTPDTARDFYRFMPRSNVYMGFEEENFDRIVNTQKLIGEIVEKRKEQLEALGAESLPSAGTNDEYKLQNIALIVDDCMDKKKPFETDSMKYVMKNGRHINFLFMIGVQYLVDFPKFARTQVDLVVVFPTGNRSVRDGLREHLLGIFETDAELVATFGQLDKYEALVFDGAAFRKNEHCLFHIKADYPIPTFRLGSDKLWWWYYQKCKLASFDSLEKAVDERLQAARMRALPPPEPEPEPPLAARVDDDDDDNDDNERLPRAGAGAGAAKRRGRKPGAGKAKPKAAPKKAATRIALPPLPSLESVLNGG